LRLTKKEWLLGATPLREVHALIKKQNGAAEEEV
jgi:hypothetical protein